MLLIADEVITGFGRTGRWFGLEHYGVEPDIMQFAKGITSGYVPLGGIGVSDAIREVINGVPSAKRWMHAYTSRDIRRAARSRSATSTSSSASDSSSAPRWAAPGCSRGCEDWKRWTASVTCAAWG